MSKLTPTTLSFSGLAAALMAMPTQIAETVVAFGLTGSELGVISFTVGVCIAVYALVSGKNGKT